MPIVIRSETDMFRILPVYPDNILINTCNCVGVMGKGIAAEFKERYPDMYKEYRATWERGELAIGKLLPYTVDEHITIVNFFSKRHWADNSDPQDILLGLKALREYLLKPEFRYHQVIMPMMGCGNGNLDYVTVYPMIMEQLNDLPNIIQLCMDPRKIHRAPRYLGIVGDRFFTDFNYLDLAVNEVMSIDWNVAIKFFDNIVSGGAPGVDTFAEGYAKDYGFKTPIIINADWDRYKKRAGFLRNMPIADISTHLIAFPRKTSVGTAHTIAAVNRWNELHPDQPKVLKIIQV